MDLTAAAGTWESVGARYYETQFISDPASNSHRGLKKSMYVDNFLFRVS